MGFLIDFFLGTTFRGSGLQLVRARAFILVCSLIIAVLAGNILAFLIVEFDEQMFKLTLLVNLALILVYFSSLMTIRFTGQLFLSVNFVVFWTNLALTLLSFLDGGAVESDIVWLCWIPLLMAFIFGGPRVGAFWAIALFLYYGLSVYLHNQNYRFPEVLSNDMQTVSTVTTWICGTATMIALAFYINYIMRHLSRIRGGNYNLLHNYLDHHGIDAPVSYELIENYIFQTGRRHKAFGDKFVLIAIALQIETDDEEIQEAIRQESFNRLQRLVRRTDLAINVDNGYYAIVIENVSTVDSATIITDSVSSLFYQPYKAGHGQVRVTPTMKHHIFPDDGIDTDEITAILRRRIKS